MSLQKRSAVSMTRKAMIHRGNAGSLVVFPNDDKAPLGAAMHGFKKTDLVQTQGSIRLVNNTHQSDGNDTSTKNSCSCSVTNKVDRRIASVASVAGCPHW